MSTEGQQQSQLKALGIDIGTMFLVAAFRDNQGKIQYRKVRDMFFPIHRDRFLDQKLGGKILKQAKAHYIVVGDQYYILGEDAHHFASLLQEEPHRPLQRGILNPKEPMRIAMVRELLRGITPKSHQGKEVSICISIPADPITGEFQTGYHAKILTSLFEEMGFSQIGVLREGVAIIYSELADWGYTGLGLSLGSGMVNFALAFKGVEIFSYSLLQAGDWIDSEAAKMLNLTANQVTAIKERSRALDLMAPLLELPEAEQAIAIQYEILMRNIIRGIKYKFEQAERPIPQTAEPFPMIIAGGSSLIKGFVPKFSALLKEAMAAAELPLTVGEVKLAEDPLHAVARGLLIAAERKRIEIAN